MQGCNMPQKLSNPSAEDIDKWSKNVQVCYDYDKTANENYTKSYKSVFSQPLTDEDLEILWTQEIPSLNFNIVRPYLLQTLKNVRDSLPSPSVQPIEEDEIDKETGFNEKDIALILTEEMKAIFKKNNWQDVVYNSSLNAAAGSKGIFKIETVYENKYNFKQNFSITNVQNPTSIYFDPSSKDVTKQDSHYYFQLLELNEDNFNEQFPDKDFNDISTNYLSGTAEFQWTNLDNNRQTRIVTLCDYYYKKLTFTPLYKLMNGETTAQKPKDSKKIDKTRQVEDCEIWRVVFSGKNIIIPPKKTNFKSPHFIFQCSERWFDHDKEVLVPYVQHALDGARTKNFMLNFFMSDALNSRKSIALVNEGISKQSEKDLQTPSMPTMVKYQEYSVSPADASVLVKNTPPQFTNSQPLQAAYLDAFEKMDPAIEKTLGIQIPSVNERDLSGKALYNLADFISGSNAIFMQNLDAAVIQIGNVILEAMPNILESRFVQSTVNKNTNISPDLQYVKMPQKAPEDGKEQDMLIQYRYKFMFESMRYKLTTVAGINYKLQQEASVEKLIDLAKIFPSWAQFMGSQVGLPLLMKNININNKEEWTQGYTEFMESQQGFAAQQAKAQKMVQQQHDAEIQAKTVTSQAKMVAAQAQEAEIELKVRELSKGMSEGKVDQLLKMMQISAENRKTQVQNSDNIKRHRLESTKFVVNSLNGRKQ